MKFFAIVFIAALVFSGGLLAGGYLFSDTQPRSLLALDQCEDTCFEQSELLGLLGSIGVQRIPNLVPNVVAETDKAVAMLHPRPLSPKHFVIIPKKDIKNVGELSPEDQEYIWEMYALQQYLVQEYDLKQYQLITNGPGFQDVSYLHFHLRGRQ